MGRLKALGNCENFDLSKCYVKYSKNINSQDHLKCISSNSNVSNSSDKKNTNSKQNRDNFFRQVNADFNRLKLNKSEWKDEIMEREYVSGLSDDVFYDDEAIDWEMLYK
ncbi:MAG: hypothetical protein ABF289_19435 [Clostridiales bacterium]